MQQYIDTLTEHAQAFASGRDFMNPAYIAAMVSISVFLIVLLVIGALTTRSRIYRRTQAVAKAGLTSGNTDSHNLDFGDRSKIDRLFARAGRLVQPKSHKDVSNIRLQLVRAGYLSPYAVAIYYGIRIILALGLPLLFVLLTSLPGIRLPAQFSLLGAAGISAVGLFVPGVILDWMRARARENYRRAFPDFMDLLVVCVEAGHSLQAALERIGREIAQTDRLLSANIHLLNLEFRAGRDLSTALRALSERLGIEEVRSLALLMRQSEELGTSLATTLRVFSDEMRDKRLMRAEARANALPVKMVIPLGMFIFPVILLVIMTPLVIRINAAFG